MYDAHTHFIPSAVIDWIRLNQQKIQAVWEKKDPLKAEFLTVGGKWSFELKDEFIDSSLFLEQQSTAGITHSLVSPIPQLFLYDYPLEIAEELSSVYNQALVKWVESSPSHLSALATVPLQSPESAAEQLRIAMSHGLKGAIIGPGTQGSMLTDENFSSFWEEADRLKAIIFIHPLLAEDPRLKRRMMPNLIGVPWETTICATDILLSGMLDRYPHVKILLAHGGGFLPYQIGRIDKGYEQWKAVSNALQAPPIEYLKRFWYDNVLWNAASLSYLKELVGEERIVPGSDFPFDLSTWPPAPINTTGIRSLLSIE